MTRYWFPAKESRWQGPTSRPQDPPWLSLTSRLLGLSQSIRANLVKKYLHYRLLNTSTISNDYFKNSIQRGRRDLGWDAGFLASTLPADARGLFLSFVLLQHKWYFFVQTFSFLVLLYPQLPIFFSKIQSSHSLLGLVSFIIWSCASEFSISY